MAASRGSRPAAPDSTSVLGPFVADGQDFEIALRPGALATSLESALRDLRVRGGEPGRPVRFRVEWVPAGPGQPCWRVWRGRDECETVTDDYAVPYILWEVTRLVLEGCAPKVPVHAAAVARRGRALILAGESHAGKSTLAGWLTAHGWEFLTDEVALVEHRPGSGWWVLPFPRPIGVRRPGPLDLLAPARLPGEPESLVPASDLGEVGGEARLSALVLLGRGPGSPVAPEPTHPATAVRMLSTHLPHRAQSGRAGFRTIVELVQQVPIYRLGTGDLARAEDHLRRLAESGREG